MNTQTYRLLGDSACVDASDPLEFHDLASGLVNLLRGAHDSTPLTLGIQAPWGMGKSSLMLHMMRQLDEDPENFKTVWFNAWTFEGEDILEGMIKTVLEQLDPNVLRRALRNRKLTSALTTIASIASHWLGISEMVNRIWDAMKVDPRSRNQLRDMLDSAMSEWSARVPCPSNGRCIVVFIDDLDRCAPENVFVVFEAIKLYLDARGLIFVLGVDSEIVSEAILEQKKYSKKITSEQYLEKIIQIAYNIPAATSEQMRALFRACCEDSGTLDLFDEDSVQLVLQRNNHNPRRIKRFINVFILEHQLNPDSRNLRPQLLIKIIMLGMYYRSFCRLFGPAAEQDREDQAHGRTDPITEFLEFSALRHKLEGQAAFDTELGAASRPVFERYGLKEPAAYGDTASALAALVAKIPEDFVVLVDQPEFEKLAASISTDDRPLVAAHIKRVGESLQTEADHVSGKPPELQLKGMRILWLDDHPDNNRTYKQDFEAAGAEVQQVISVEKAITELKPDPGRFDLLLSDVARDNNRLAGFEDLPTIRKTVGFSGPVVFFVGSVRTADRDICNRLGTQITNDPVELYRIIDQISANRYQTKDPAGTSHSTLFHKMQSLPAAEQRAAILLQTCGPEQAIARLEEEGIPPAMAETAVARARSNSPVATAKSGEPSTTTPADDPVPRK